MNVEYKSLPYFVKKLDEETRTVTGIFAVHGNRDDGGDISINGSFEKHLNSGRKRVRFLWNHDGWQPPIASIKSVREVGRDELPDEVLKWAPDATGGVEVIGQYYEDIPLSEWVFKGIQAGDITEMSYAYEIHKYEIKVEEAEEGGDKTRTRILQEVELYDISDVNWGMNPATAGVKGLPAAGMTFTQHSEMVVSTLEKYVERVKDRKNFREWEERTLSKSVQERLVKVGLELQTILEETAPKADQAEVQEVLNDYLRIERDLLGVVDA